MKAATKFKVFCIRYFLKTKRKPAKKKQNSVYRVKLIPHAKIIMPIIQYQYILISKST